MWCPITNHGKIQGFFEVAKNPRCHWCCFDTYRQIKNPNICCRILFIQIKGLQHAAIGHCWSQEMISECFCGVAKISEWCVGVVIVFNLWKNNMGQFSQWTWFAESIKPYIIEGKGYPYYHGQWFFINKWEFDTLFWKHYSTSNFLML